MPKVLAKEIKSLIKRTALKLKLPGYVIPKRND